MTTDTDFKERARALRERIAAIEERLAALRSRASCEHCGSGGADFEYNRHPLCAECMSEFISWLLDGGIVENPDQFAEIV